MTISFGWTVLKIRDRRNMDERHRLGTRRLGVSDKNWETIQCATGRSVVCDEDRCTDVARRAPLAPARRVKTLGEHEEIVEDDASTLPANASVVAIMMAPVAKNRA